MKVAFSIMKQQIKSLIRRVVFKRKTFAESWYDSSGYDSRVSYKRARELKKMGFCAGKDLVYDFERFGYENYVTDRDIFRIHPINGEFSKLIDDKRFLSIIMQNANKYLPDLTISIDNGRVNFVLGLDHVNVVSCSLNEILEKALEKYENLIVKPIGLSGGKGVFKLNRYNLLEKRPILEESSRLVINNYLINEDYALKINPHGLNTYRVIFFRSSCGKNKCFKVIHRFGTLRSQGVDNISQGGMAAIIDLETGQLGKAMVIEDKEHEVWVDHHLDTGHLINGLIVPNWGEKMEQINEILNHLYFIEYGGVDVAPTTTGLKVIEINSLPSLRLLQMDRPAFENEEFKKFLTRKGY